MFGRLMTTVEVVRSSLWFWPVVLSAMAIMLAQGTIGLDHTRWLEERDLTWLFGSGIADARSLLATVAAAMISIAATVFSITIVALSLAAGQLGPRLLRTFMRDRGTQVSLGMFIATFAFCVSVLGVLDASGKEPFVPRASVSLAMVLALTCLAVLIYFIHHVAYSIQASTVIRVVGEELAEALARLYPRKVPPGDRTGADSRLASPAVLPTTWSSVTAETSGYIQYVNDRAIVELAERIDALIILAREPGAYVIAGTEIARIGPSHRNIPEVIDAIRGAISCGSIRTPMQDPLYLVNQIVEIAQRALSPGINDPSTAETCIDQLGSALGDLLQREIPVPIHRGEQGAVRLMACGADFARFVAAVFDPIRNYSRGCRQVSLRMADLIGQLAPLTRSDAQREPLVEQATRLQRAAADLPEPDDRRAVEEACGRAFEALAITPSVSADEPSAVARARTTTALLVGALGALLAFSPVPEGQASPSVSVLPDTPADLAPGAPIAVQADAGDDRKIAGRLEQLYAAAGGLDEVQAEVHGGVVTLTGVVASREAHKRAIALARRVETVVDVRDGISESADLRTRLLPTLNRLWAQAMGLVALLPLLGVALVVLLGFWWVARLISCSKQFERVIRHNSFLRDLLRQIVRVLITALGVVLALEILDASRLLTTLLGAAGVVGLALGFALRDTVENYIASLLLSLRQPFAHNDHVVIENNEGRVVRLTPRATILMTLDGNHTRIPNAKVYKAVILNYTRNPKRRFAFDVGVDTEQNLADAQGLAARTLKNMDGVLNEPAPYCTVETLGDSNVILRVFGWVDQSKADFLRVRSEAIRLVKRSYDDAGIVMPEPIYNIRMQSIIPAAATNAEAGLADRKADARPDAPGAGRLSMRSARKLKDVADEPAEALGIAIQDDLGDQIAADRRATGEDDLLSPNARKE
ncbi:MAG: DUF2254 family protein [Gammaproteobacteria bacterium]